MAEKTLVAAVIFPGVENYLPDFLKSIKIQTDTDFTLLIVNDGIVSINHSEFKDAKWIELNSHLSPAAIRQLIYTYAIESGYEILIFCDADDFCEKNRIEIVKKSLKHYDFMCNDLTLISSRNNVIQKNFLAGFFTNYEINDFTILEDKNLVGLGNSAIRLNQNLVVEIPDYLIAVDWFLYTILLINGLKGIFTEETTTFYRQHTHNLVGVAKELNETRLSRGIEVKLKHYRALQSYCNKFNFKESSLFGEKLGDIENLIEALNNKNFKKKYLQIINKHFDKIYSGWWSEILTLDQIKIYEN